MATGDRRGAMLGPLCGFCLGLVLCACEIAPTEVFRPQLAVHGLLLTGDPYAQVIVNRTYALDETADTVMAEAEVRLWRGDDTWRLVHQGRDLYRAVLGASKCAHPYDTWYLRVTKPGFDTVYGRTIVPDTFSILYPKEQAVVNMHDSLGWTRSRNCRGYDLALRAIYPKDTFYYDIVLPNDTTGRQRDSLRVHLPHMYFMYGYDPGAFYLPVLALDTNYYDWVRAGGFGPGAGGDGAAHLVGGAGVFGSASLQEVTVFLWPGAAATSGAIPGGNPQVSLRRSGRGREARLDPSLRERDASQGQR